MDANTDMTAESSQPDPYATLGIKADAGEANIRKAWRKRTKSIGPGTPEFATINDAAELLLDPQRRAAYDAEVTARREEAEQEAAEAAQPADGESPADESTEDVPAGTQKPVGSRFRAAFSGWNGTVTLAGLIALVAVILAIWQGVDYTSSSSGASGGVGVGTIPASNFEQPQADQQAVLSAVRTGLPAVLSYRYDQMAANQANAERFLTAKARPGLEASYQRLINGGTIPGCKTTLEPIAQRQTVVTATVVSAGIVSVGRDVAQIGAFVNQTTTVAGKAAVTTQNRVLVNLQKVNGSWLIDTMTVPNTDHVLTC